MPEPLDRYLTRNGAGSWAEVRVLIHRGRVAVDGLPTRRYRHPLEPGAVVAVDGTVLPDRTDATVLLCHKPVGLACSHDPDDVPLIYGIVPQAWWHPDLHSCGRLDRNTSGLIVLTIDGRLTQRLTDPARACWKRYRVGYAGALAADAAALVEAGLVLADDGTRCRPAVLVPDGPGRCTIELREGLFHQVKRMVQTLGGRVVDLHRDRIGGLELPPDLGPGAMRPPTPAELAAISPG